MCVCVYDCSNCSTPLQMQVIAASSHFLLDFDSWICKLKLSSRVMVSFAYLEGHCSLFRLLRSTICSYSTSLQ